MCVHKGGRDLKAQKHVQPAKPQPETVNSQNDDCQKRLQFRGSFTFGNIYCINLTYYTFAAARSSRHKRGVQDSVWLPIIAPEESKAHFRLG